MRTCPLRRYQRPAASRSRRPVHSKHRFPIRKLKLPRALRVNLLQQARTHGSLPILTILRAQTGMSRARTEPLFILQLMPPHVSRTLGGAERTTFLHLSDIPDSMNGWTVYASFSGNGGPVYTGAAKIRHYTCLTLARDGGSRDPGPGTSNSCSDRRSRSDPGACSDSDRRTRALPFPTPEPEENKKKTTPAFSFFGAVAITALICGTVINLETLENKKKTQKIRQDLKTAEIQRRR